MTAKFLFSATAAAALLLAPTLSLAAPLSDPQRQEIAETINAYAPRMQEVASTIWHNPELGYLETETAALLQGELSAHGFAIDRGVAGIPTAFVASRGSADGPVIAILAEMDALPGFSQTASPTQQPMDALTAGHACGHHLFGAGSVAAAIAVADYLEAMVCPVRSVSMAPPPKKAAPARSIWCAPGCLTMWT